MEPDDIIGIERSHGALLDKRSLALRSILIGLFLVLAVGFWRLQIVKGGDYHRLAEENRLTWVEIHAQRGIITDRHGEVLARNRPSFQIQMRPDEVSNLESTVRRLAPLLDISKRELHDRATPEDPFERVQPVILVEDAAFETVARVDSHRVWYQSGEPTYLTGVETKVHSRREYPFGDLTAPWLGYVGETSREELKRFADRKTLGDVIGKTGLERQYDRILSGTDGYKRVVVDSLGRVGRVIDRKPPVVGSRLELTLDLGIQKAARDALKDLQGSAVVLDLKDGGILAMASSPTYDLNNFVRSMSREEWLAISEDPATPLRNRAIQNAYPPGSLFKLILAVGGLEEGLIDPEARVFCRGSAVFFKRTFRCWRGGGHGFVNLEQAIARSCNVYFYHAGRDLGAERIATYARELGLSFATGVDLPGEATGVIPDPDWKKATLDEPWYPGETISVSIGQGAVSTTPIQMAVLVSAIAGKGEYFQPHLIHQKVEADGWASRYEPEARSVSGVRPETFHRVMNGMRRCCLTGGTGADASIPDAVVAGKTGTAQIVGLRAAEEADDARYKPHAWFAGFAPADNPRYAVVIMVEHGGSGGETAAPLAGKILAACFEAQEEPEDRDHV